MKTFKQYLKEEVNEDKLTETINYIKENCSQFLSNVDMPLYRGMSASTRNKTLYNEGSQKILECIVRKDRNPVDSPIALHDVLNTFFEDKFGVKARSEGLFVSGSIEMANVYNTSGLKSNTYVILPIGDYELITSDIIHDATSELINGVIYLSESIYDIDFTNLCGQAIYEFAKLKKLSPILISAFKKCLDNKQAHDIRAKTIEYLQHNGDKTPKEELNSAIVDLDKLQHSMRYELLEFFLLKYGEKAYKMSKSISASAINNETAIICDKYIAISYKLYNKINL